MNSPSSELTIVNRHLTFPAVPLIEPSPSIFIHLAAEIDARPAFLPSSRKKKRVIARCKEMTKPLQSVPGVSEVVVFKAFLVPPGREIVTNLSLLSAGPLFGASLYDARCLGRGSSACPRRTLVA